MTDEPNIDTLAGHVRNRLKAGQTTTVILDKRRVHFIPHVVLGQEIPGVLVASDKGESLWVQPSTVLNTVAFQAGGFSLRRARLLGRVFSAIRGKSKAAIRD